MALEYIGVFPKSSIFNRDADCTDAFILEKSKYDTASKDEQFDGLYSFDVAAQQLNDVVKP